MLLANRGVTRGPDSASLIDAGSYPSKDVCRVCTTQILPI